MIVIYGLLNTVTDRVYVGCTSQSLNRRFNEHMSRMKNKVHYEKAMVNDYDDHGKSSYTLIVLEQLQENADIIVKREAELRWMKHYRNLGLLYNTQAISFQPGIGASEKSHTPEANEKRRNAQLGKHKREGQGAKISATKKSLGQRPSIEAARMGAIACHKVRYGKS